MITEENLHFLRAYEIQLLARYLKPGSYILEIGAGTGFQAKTVSERGLKIAALDVAQSSRAARRGLPVTDYDGLTLPFPDQTFDIVFTSNVLEHVSSLPVLLAEMRRVLRPGGYCVHAMPTTTWRLWTSLSGYVDLPFYLFAVLRRILRPDFRQFARAVAGHVVPRSHGKVHSLLAELWTFSRRYWINKFRQSGFEVIRAEPMGLFYTGWSVLGTRCSARRRESIARFLGSSCTVYEVKPRM